MAADRTVPRQNQEVLKRSNEEAAKAREAGNELRKSGVMARVRGFFGLLWATVLAFFSDDCQTMAALQGGERPDPSLDEQLEVMLEQ